MADGKILAILQELRLKEKILRLIVLRLVVKICQFCAQQPNVFVVLRQTVNPVKTILLISFSQRQPRP